MTETGIASRYALAFVEAITDPGAGIDSRAALKSLNDFIGVLESSRDLDVVLVSPSIAPAKKREVVRFVADRIGAPARVRNLLFVLSDHRRLTLLRDVASEAAVMLDEKLGFVRAAVSVAAPLNEAEQQRIATQFSRVVGKQVLLDVKVDPDLIGGVVARVGSKVYDGSVRGRLKSLGQRLMAS